MPPLSHTREILCLSKGKPDEEIMFFFLDYILYLQKKQPHVSVCLWACGYKRWSWLWLKTKWPHLSIRSPIQIYCSAIVLQYYSLPCHIISQLADTEIAQWISCLRWVAKARSETLQFTVQYHTQQMWQHDEIKMQYPNQKAIDMMEVKLSFLYCLLTASQWFLIYKPWLPQMSSSPLKPQPSGNSEILPPGIQCKNKLA